MSIAADPAIAALVREVLAEEVARLRAEKGARPQPPASMVREERVRIRSDAELRDFVARVLAMAEDREARAALAAGRIVFRLDGGQSSSAAAGNAARPRLEPGAEGAGHTETLERGLLTERQAERLPRETKRVRLGRQARLTPLARDRLRRRGIVIERIQR